MDYKNLSEKIKNSINLESEPVAVGLFESESEAKKCLEKSDKTIHCQAVITASKGNSFYATANELGCPIALQVLGLREPTEKLMSGEHFANMGVTKSQEKGKSLISMTPISERKIEAIGYMPLGETTFTPEVIAIIGKPKQVYNIIRAYVYQTGQRLEGSVSGTQSLCGDVVVKSINENSINISYGCAGSHLATEFKETDVAIGIPIDKIESIAQTLEIVRLPE